MRDFARCGGGGGGTSVSPTCHFSSRVIRRGQIGRLRLVVEIEREIFSRVVRFIVRDVSETTLEQLFGAAPERRGLLSLGRRLGGARRLRRARRRRRRRRGGRARADSAGLALPWRARLRGAGRGSGGGLLLPRLCLRFSGCRVRGRRSVRDCGARCRPRLRCLSGGALRGFRCGGRVASAFGACGATRRRSRSRLSAEHMPAARAFERRGVLRQNPFVDSIAGLTTCALDLDHLSPHLLRDPITLTQGSS